MKSSILFLMRERTALISFIFLMSNCMFISTYSEETIFIKDFETYYNSLLLNSDSCSV